MGWCDWFSHSVSCMNIYLTLSIYKYLSVCSCSCSTLPLPPTLILNRHQAIKLVVCAGEHRARVSILSANKHDYVHGATYEERTLLNGENHVLSPNSISFPKILLIPILNTYDVPMCAWMRRKICLQVFFRLCWTEHFNSRKTAVNATESYVSFDRQQKRKI